MKLTALLVSAFGFISSLTFLQGASPAVQSPTRQERFLDIFEPFRTTHAALSPDGQHLAYSYHSKGRLAVLIVATENPGKVLLTVGLGSDAGATPMLTDNDEQTPAAVLWMRWTTSERLVVMTNKTEIVSKIVQVPFGEWLTSDAPARLDGSTEYDDEDADARAGPRRERSPAPTWNTLQNLSGGIFAIDLEARTATRLLRAGDLRRVSSPAQGAAGLLQPAIFDVPPTEDGALLIRGYSGPYNEFYRLNTVTGKRTYLHDELGTEGMVSLFDRQGKLRAGIPTAAYDKPPFHYLLAKQKAISLGRWQKTDEILGQLAGSTFSVSPENQFGRRAVPIGFDENPDILYYASNAGRDTYGIYGVNLKTGQRTFTLEDSRYDLIEPTFGGFAAPRSLVFDRFSRQLVGIRLGRQIITTHWLRDDLSRIQSELEKAFPGSNVEIIEWDRDVRRFLVLMHDSVNPGSYYLFEPARQRILDIARRAAWGDTPRGHRAFRFSTTTAGGNQVNGLLTFPRVARFKNVPVVVRFATEPWLRVPLDYQAETTALAEMGFAVLQLDGPGAWGFGIKQRERLKNGYEHTQIDDALTAVDHLAKRYRIDPQRVALLGEGHGGYVALRGLQLRPDRFRCAVTVDAPIDLGSWLENDRWTRHTTQLELSRAAYGDRQTLKDPPLTRHPELVTKPVCLLIYPGARGAARSALYLETKRFISAVRRQGTPVEFTELDEQYAVTDSEPQGADSDRSQLLELNRDFVQRLPRAQAAVYRNIESFLNAYIYDYSVKLGPLKLIPDTDIEYTPLPGK